MGCRQSAPPASASLPGTRSSPARIGPAPLVLPKVSSRRGRNAASPPLLRVGAAAGSPTIGHGRRTPSIEPRPMIVLVPSAGGQAGEQVVPRLPAAGHDVRASARSVPDGGSRGAETGSVDWYAVDVVSGAFTGVDAVILCVHAQGKVAGRQTSMAWLSGFAQPPVTACRISSIFRSSESRRSR